MKNKTLLLVGLALLAGWYLLRHGGLGAGVGAYDMGPKNVMGGLYGGGQ